ncbi:MAG: hypothetical protein LKI17_06270 [Megasphaera cerevisiae]|jgi:hypothetical protein|nr:hypothetical protein [Megasphaera cerevisiae]
MRPGQIIVRPNLRLGTNVGAVMKYHTAATRSTAAIYVGQLIYNDLKNRYPELMKDVSENESFIPRK